MSEPKQPQSLNDYLKLSTAEKMELFKAEQAVVQVAKGELK